MRHRILGLIFALLLTAPAVHADGKKKIVFIAGTPSHEFGGHEHNAGCLLLGKSLRESQLADQLDVVVLTSKKDNDGKWISGWPADTSVLQDAAAIVIYCDGGENHIALQHEKEIDDLARKGCGIGLIHYAVEPGEKNGRSEFLNWVGGYFETFLSINPHWTARFTDLPDHPVTRGVYPFVTTDEWYFHMRLRPEMKGVTAILSAIPPPKVGGSDTAHNGDAEVQHPNGPRKPEVVLWVSENPDPDFHGERGFGCTGGHVHWNWAQDDFRKTVLNAILWIAHVDVPADGVNSPRPSVTELLANMDAKKRPAEKTDEWIAQQIEKMNQPLASK